MAERAAVVYRTPSKPANPKRTRQSRYKLLVGLDAFELSTWDFRPAISAVVSSMVLASALAMIGTRWFLGTVAAVFVCAFTARCALVVTRTRAHVVHRVLGIQWSRIDVGAHPNVIAGLGWDWSELAVLPREPELRAKLHDGERVVMREWGLDDGFSDEDATRAVSIANEQIARLLG